MFSIQPHYCSPSFHPSSSPPSVLHPLDPITFSREMTTQCMFPHCCSAHVWQVWMLSLYHDVDVSALRWSLISSQEVVFRMCGRTQVKKEGRPIRCRAVSCKRRGQWKGCVSFFLSPAFKCSSQSPHSFCFSFLKEDNRVSLLHFYIRWMWGPIKPNPLTANKNIQNTYKTQWEARAFYVPCVIMTVSLCGHTL